MGLTERDRAILDLERTWWTRPGPKETAVREQLRLSPARYYAVLRELAGYRAAFEYDPLTVSRVRRRQARRRRDQIEGRRAGPGAPMNIPMGRPPVGPGGAARRQAMSSGARGFGLVGLAALVAVIGVQILEDDTGTSASPAPSTTTIVPGAAGSSTTAGGSSSSAATTKATTTTKAATTTTKATTTKAATTTTTTPGRPKSQVSVDIANGSGVQGAAQTMFGKLKGLGWNAQGVLNADSRTGTVVACRAGYEKEAASLAVDVGGGAKVEAFPSNPPAGTEASVNCLVTLGK